MSSKENLIKTFARKIGMDGAIAYSSAARVFQAFAGVISIFFIATFLTGEEQGFFYTFGSILAIQVFFELGFTGIMTQYVAHEAAHLSLNHFNEYEGDDRYKSRLSYLIKFCLKWYTVIAIAFFVIVNIIGVIYFERYDISAGSVSWFYPWILLSFSTAIKLFQSPFTAIYQGLGKVKEMNRIIFYQQLIIPISQWILFACGLKLYVIGISSLLGVIVWCAFVLGSDLWPLFTKLLKLTITERVSYMKEIFPYQWKIALSWISGYFIFQLFNPVLFATEGAVIAGQMGMTLQVLNAIQAFAFSWQNTKVPYYSGLIALKNYKQLDIVFNKTLKQMMLVCCALIIMMIIVLKYLDYSALQFGGTVLSERFLGILPTLLLSATVIANQYITSWATYLRCHKQEPFLVNSVVLGVLCCLSTFIFGRLYGLYGIVIGYSVLTIGMALPWAFIIYMNKKKEWHG